jgi:hypothetical protein
MTARQARQGDQVADLRFLELAPGLEPGTCCLQVTCAASITHSLVASGQVRSGQVRRLAGVLASNPIDRRGMSNGMTAALPSVCRRADSKPRRCAGRPVSSVSKSLSGRFRDGMHVICVYTADCRAVEDRSVHRNS